MKFRMLINEHLTNAPRHRVWIEVEHYFGEVQEIKAPKEVFGNIANVPQFNIAVENAAKNNYQSFCEPIQNY